MTPSEVLAQAIRARLEELGLSMSAWKRASGVSDPILREMRDGARESFRPHDERRAEQALGWMPLSFPAIRTGADPKTRVATAMSADRARVLERLVELVSEDERRLAAWLAKEGFSPRISEREEVRDVAAERPADSFSLDERLAKLPARERRLVEAQVSALLDVVESQVRESGS